MDLGPSGRSEKCKVWRFAFKSKDNHHLCLIRRSLRTKCIQIIENKLFGRESDHLREIPQFCGKFRHWRRTEILRFWENLIASARARLSISSHFRGWSSPLRFSWKINNPLVKRATWLSRQYAKISRMFANIIRASGRHSRGLVIKTTPATRCFSPLIAGDAFPESRESHDQHVISTAVISRHITHIKTARRARWPEIKNTKENAGERSRN